MQTLKVSLAILIAGHAHNMLSHSRFQSLYSCIYGAGNGSQHFSAIFFLPHPAGGEAASRVGPKIVLDHVRVYICIKKNYVCALWVSSPLVVYDAIDNASSSRATRTEK